MNIEREPVFAKRESFRLDPLRTPGHQGLSPAALNSGERAIDLPGARPSDRGLYTRFIKRTIDIAVVLVTAPITVPVILLAAFALWIESGLPFYRQSRRGLGGHSFQILKLRTMVRDADAVMARLLDADPALREEWETTQKLKCDPRITRVGNVLRKTSLDELPQLWNVLVGEMSLVGPRPMMTDQAALYGPIGHYDAMRPGITGPWQVSDRNETLFAARNTFDSAYRMNVSLRTDLGLMLRTVGVVFRRTGY